MRLTNTNKVVLTGEIIDKFEFSHETYEEKFYKTFICVGRRSDVSDYLPIIVSEKLMNPDKDLTGERYSIEGTIRSYSYEDEAGKHLTIYAFVDEIALANDRDDFNEVELVGYVTKEPKYRTTPQGKEITDLLVAVNRLNHKSDYLPCICWGRNAKYMQFQDVGTKVSIKARFQSREYTKKYDDGTCDIKQTYEVSVMKLKVEEDADD